MKFPNSNRPIPSSDSDITAVGFASQQINVADAGAALSIQLMEQTSQLEEIIVAASRTPERIAESPVSVERLSLKDIQNTTAPDFTIPGKSKG